MTNQERKLSRRDFMRLSALAAVSGLVSACENNPAVQAVLASAQADLRPSPTPDQPVKLESIPQFGSIPQYEQILNFDPITPEEVQQFTNSLPPVETTFDPEGEVLPEYFSPVVKFWYERGFLNRWSRNYHLPLVVVASIMQIESAGYLFAKSPAGAQCLFQVMPHHFNQDDNCWDPETNANIGLRFFREGLKIAESKGYKDFEAYCQAARGYNAGHGVIGADYSSLPTETKTFDRLFRAFATDNKEGTDWFKARATTLLTDAENWLKEWKNTKGVRLPLNLYHSVIAHNIKNLISLSGPQITQKHGQLFDYLAMFEPFTAERGFQKLTLYGDGACYHASALYQLAILSLIPGLIIKRVNQGEKLHDAFPGIDPKYTVTIFTPRGVKPTDYLKINRGRDQNCEIYNFTGQTIVFHSEIQGQNAVFWLELLKKENSPSTDSQVETSKTEIARINLEKMAGIPYKAGGYKDNLGKWCTWDGINPPVVDNLPGLNCGGFLLEAVRTLFRKIELEAIQKQPLANRPANDPDWLWYGYDEVVSLAKATNGKIFKTDDLNWQEGSGFSVKDWKTLGTKLRTGYVYFASINKPDPKTSRIHHHVALILPSDQGILVYEAVSPQSQGIVLEDFLRRYINDQDYRVFLTESPLSAENIAENSKVYDKQKGAFLPTVGPVYLQGNIFLRQSVGSENGSLNSWFVHGNRNYEGVPSWLGQDFVTKSENKTIVSPIEGIAEPGVDPNAGYFISIKGTGKHAGLHLRIIHLKQENRPSGQIGVGQKIGTEGPQKHVHVICLWGNGDFLAENKDVPFSLLLEPKNQPTGTYIDKNDDGSNFIEFYAPSNSKFSWFELKN